MNKIFCVLGLFLSLQNQAAAYIDYVSPIGRRLFDRETCNITVSLLGNISPARKELVWPGNYKIGFETFGNLKLEGVELGKKYVFAIPCHHTYVKLHFDYATHPFVGEVRVLIEYKDQKMLVSLKAENCEEYKMSDYFLCTGVNEKFINNITVR